MNAILCGVAIMITAKLSSVFLGEKPVRYLYYRAPCSILTDHTSALNHTDLPLFLAADVLAGSSQAVKNHARIHARYAKDGLATRLVFNNVKIEGMHNSSVVWFYNTQGLFKVVFELLNTAAQRDCLTQLKALWLARYTDPTMTESMDVNEVIQHDICNEDPKTATDSVCTQNGGVTVQRTQTVECSVCCGDVQALSRNLDGDVTGESLNTKRRLEISDVSQEAGCVGINGSLCMTSDGTKRSLGVTSDHGTKGSLGATSEGIDYSHGVTCDRLHGSLSDFIHTNLRSPTGSGDSNSEVLTSGRPDHDNHVIDNSHDEITSSFSNSSHAVRVTDSSSESMIATAYKHCPFCQRSYFGQQRHSTECDDEMKFLVDDILELLQDKMTTLSVSGQDLLQKLVVLIEFFRHEFLVTDPSGESPAFPFSVLEQYTLLIKNCATQKLFGNKFDIACRRNAVLCLLSEWLGSQMHLLSDALQCKVMTFKERNINCVENLPCPRTLVDLVFPRCMQILLVHWLGQEEEEVDAGEGHGASDHSYSSLDVDDDGEHPSTAKGASVASTTTPDKFPFIQFILEFANNALISGVAHVVYSRLVNSY